MSRVTGNESKVENRIREAKEAVLRINVGLKNLASLLPWSPDGRTEMGHVIM